jgi:hypothetical protein
MVKSLAAITWLIRAADRENEPETTAPLKISGAKNQLDR